MLATIGALLTIGLGVLGAVAPHRAARLVGIAPVGGVGVSEIRATYGGLFIALGAACLALGSPVAYTVAGIAWLGAASMRLPSLLLDEGAFPKAIGGAAIEGLIGALLLTGAT
jgi:hypothetical protein